MRTLVHKAKHISPVASSIVQLTFFVHDCILYYGNVSTEHLTSLTCYNISIPCFKTNKLSRSWDLTANNTRSYILYYNTLPRLQRSWPSRIATSVLGASIRTHRQSDYHLDTGSEPDSLAGMKTRPRNFDYSDARENLRSVPRRESSTRPPITLQFKVFRVWRTATLIHFLIMVIHMPSKLEGKPATKCHVHPLLYEVCPRRVHLRSLRELNQPLFLVVLSPNFGSYVRLEASTWFSGQVSHEGWDILHFPLRRKEPAVNVQDTVRANTDHSSQKYVIPLEKQVRGIDGSSLGKYLWLQWIDPAWRCLNEPGIKYENVDSLHGFE